MLIYVGAFAEKNVFEDLGVVLLFGGIGWVMAKLGWPRPPLLLGLVLGPLAENKLFLSTDNYGFGWLARPGVLILAAVMVGGLLYPFWSERKRRRSGLTPQQEPDAAPAAGGLRFDGTTAFALAIVVLFAWALWQSRGFGTRAGLFPWAVCIPGLTLAILQLARDVTGHRDRPSEVNPAEAALDEGPDVPPDVARRRSIEMAAWIVGYLVAIWLIGFSVGTLVMTFLYLKVGARERWPMTIVMSAFGFAFVYGIFEKGLGVPFPPGRLLSWLGLGS
jgi:hypothetical protein